MVSNCSSHKSRLATGWLDEHSSYFSVINWPPRSPDLHPIDHLWDVLEQGVRNAKKKEINKSGRTMSLSFPYAADCQFRIWRVHSWWKEKSCGNQNWQAARGILATDLVILNHGQVTRATPELAPPLLTTALRQQKDVRALDRFNVNRSPTRRVFSGTATSPLLGYHNLMYANEQTLPEISLATFFPIK
ncbi:uncharacterized protein TNCV_3480011 [Trichonephila clavipes]|nr:uncharacterized protein TNCV_3480011 [Trichonephila clavipes]